MPEAAPLIRDRSNANKAAKRATARTGRADIVRPAADDADAPGIQCHRHATIAADPAGFDLAKAPASI